MNLHDVIDPALAIRLVLTFGHFLWQGMLILLLAGAAAWLLRCGSAQTRYGLWMSALLVMAVCPVATFMWMGERGTVETVLSAADSDVPQSPSQAPQPTVTLEAPVSTETPAPTQSVGSAEPPPTGTQGTSGPLMTAHEDTGDRLRQPPARSSMSGREEPAPTARSGGFDWRRYAPHVLLAYLLGAGLLLARLVAGLHGGQRLRRLSEPVEEAAILTALARQARALGLRFTPAVARCGRIAVPAVVGVLRPMILLPLSLATSFTPEQIEVLLAHELAHIRRYDHLWNLLQRLIEALLFFHPAVWIVSGRIRAEREHCCDDYVLAAGGKRLVYAESLVRVAELSLVGDGARPAVAVAALGAQGRPSELRGRITRLLGGAAHERVHLRRTWALAIGLLGAAALTINCLRPAHAPSEPGALTSTRPTEDSRSEQINESVADSPAPVPPVWVSLLVTSPVASFDELRYTLHIEPVAGGDAFTEVKTCELEIRSTTYMDYRPRRFPLKGLRTSIAQAIGRPDNARTLFTSFGLPLARIGVTREAMAEPKRLIDTAHAMVSDGGYEMCVYVNDVRCSNLAPFTVDAQLETRSVPVLQLSLLSSKPGAELPDLGLQVLAPTPADPALNVISVLSAPLMVDDVEHKVLGLGGNLDPSPLPAGQRRLFIIDPEVYHPQMDPDRPHKLQFKAGTYASELVTLARRAPRSPLRSAQAATSSAADDAEAARLDPPSKAGFAGEVAERIERMLRDKPVAFLTEQDVRALVASFREFVTAHPPKPMSSPRRETLLAAVENEVRWWGQTNPEHIYLQFDQKVDSLKMNLWLAMNRGELDAGQLARMQEQRQWMRDFIGDLPEDPRFARDPVLAELANAFQNPFCVFFDRSMKDDEWARFTRSVEADPETKRFPHIPIRLAQAAGNVQYSREMLSDFPSPFDDRVYAGGPWIDGFQFSFRSVGSGLRSNVISDIDLKRRAILSMDSNHLQSVPDDVQGSDALKEWISTLQEGDLYYDDADGGALVAVRGTRLALLGLDGWLASDQLTDDALRELVTRHGRSMIHLKEMTELERAMKSMSMRLAALTSAGQLAVLNARFIGPVFDRLEVTIRPRPLPKMKYVTVGAAPRVNLAAKTEAVAPPPSAAAATSTPEGDLSSKAPEERLGALMRAITEGKASRVRAILDRYPELLNPAQSKYPPLFEAAMRNNLPLAQMLIDRGAEVEVADSQGYTALDRCGNYGYAQMAELLIKAGANVNAVNAQRKEGTPLHTAASEGQNNVIEVLIKHGADLNANAFGGFTPLTVAVLTGHADSAQLLAKHGAELDLLGAAGVGRLDVVQRIVEADPQKAKSAVAAGMTVLHTAALGGYVEVIQYLLDKGADPNAKGMQNITPLTGAARYGHAAAVEILIKAGADVNGPGQNGTRPLSAAVFPNPHLDVFKVLLAHGAEVKSMDEGGSTPLHSVAMRGSPEMVQMLLERGADVNARNNGSTPLHNASDRANLPVMEALLNAGADIEAVNERGATPLHAAVEHSGDSTAAMAADLLLAYGANVNARNNQGQTCLHHAARSGFMNATIELLLAAGADPGIRDQNGQSPLDVAIGSAPDVIRRYKENATRREESLVNAVAVNLLGAVRSEGWEHMLRSLVIESPPRLTYEQWLKSAAEIRKVYTKDKERLTAIRETLVEGDRAAVRVDGPEGSGRYLFLILGKTRGGWRVTAMDDSSEGIPLKTHLLNAATQPAEGG
ncbi:MAG: hypothetical protein AMXMBFR13_35660 [Phycisphaerae bacterium]